MFMTFVWLVVCIAGGVVAGQVDFVRVTLDDDISDTDTTITVSSTEGFPDTGLIVIEDERIAYSDKNDTEFVGNLAKPVVRGADGTEAAAHSTGAYVSTVQGGMLNSSASYNIAVIADSAGSMAFVSTPLALFSLLGSFFFLPLTFLGTDLQILTYIWAVVGIGMLISLTVALVGGRRV